MASFSLTSFLLSVVVTSYIVLECGRQRGIRAPHKPSQQQQAGVCENPQHIKRTYSAEGDTEWPSVLTA